MKFGIQIIIMLILTSFVYSEKAYSNTFNRNSIKEDLTEILSDIKNSYVYLEKKKIDLQCIKDKYTKKIDMIKSRDESILFFGKILNEFYDNHIHLNIAVYDSYRLSSPIYVHNKKEKTIITSVWQSQIQNLNENIIGAEILNFNQQEFSKNIDQFKMECADKNDPVVREWVSNKILSGRYGQPRILELKLLSGKKIQLNIDELKLKKHDTLLSFHKTNDVGVIRIND